MLSLGDELLERAVEKVSEYGKELAHWESLYEQLKIEMKSRIDLKYLELIPEKMTQREREARANSSEEVLAFIPKIAEAKKKYIELRHKIKSAELYCDLFRTCSSNKRAEQQMYRDLT